MTQIKTNKKDCYFTDNFKHTFTIKNLETNKTATVEGSFLYGSYGGDSASIVYKFKTNNSGVREVLMMKYPNGDFKYKIEAMFRNKPIEKCEVLEHIIEDRFTEQESEKHAIMYQLHERIKRISEGEYIHFNKPFELELPDKTINVEYITCDCLGSDDIINYRTDHIRFSKLNKEQLLYIKKFI